jgi:glycosyltransferase involved in cell wall biosynthesis
VNKLTVVQILPALNSGGVERCTLETARALVADGHRSIVISSGGRLVAQLIQEGSEHICFPVHRKSWRSFFQIKPLRHVINSLNVDITHARSRIPAWITWLAWRGMPAATRPRFITTVHGMHSVSPYSAIMVKGEAVIAGSETVRRYILENYPQCPAERIQLIPEGVDPTEFPYGHKPDGSWLTQWQNDFPELKGKTVLALPGRITRLKGHATFIALIKSLREQHPEIHGLIIGGAEAKKAAYAAEIKTLVAHEGLSEHISFTGHRSDMRDVLSQCHLLFSLSTQPETFGRTVLESIRLGRPVMGWDVGGVSEILQACYPQGRVPVNDTAALHQACAHWLQYPDRPERNTNFLLSTMCTQTLALYQELTRPHEW